MFQPTYKDEKDHGSERKANAWKSSSGTHFDLGVLCDLRRKGDDLSISTSYMKVDCR